MMKKIVHRITNNVSTMKGAWLTVIAWVVIAILLTLFSPNPKDYKVSSLSTLLPADKASVIAEKKIEEYFVDVDGTPAILVWESENGEITAEELVPIVTAIEEAKIKEIKEIVPLAKLPPEALGNFLSEDKKAGFVPFTLTADLDTKEIKVVLEHIYNIAEKESDIPMYITGPAGIAVDTSNLFSRADFVLLFSTVGIILVLLIFTYRSPLLALIPLLAAGFVYQVVNQTLGFIGVGGIELASQSLSIMMILLFAVIIDYSLFIFSRFQEELKKYENKYEAMRLAMREIGVPIFYSGTTILLAMLILFFAQFGDYRNFGPIFSVAVLIVMIAAITLVPALFTIFGRTSFWPKIPRVGDEYMKASSFWSKVGSLVVRKPVGSVIIVLGFLLLSAFNLLNINNEFDTMKSFPEDMPSRLGYEVLEEHFDKGDLAPTSVLWESDQAISEEDRQIILQQLQEQDLVSTVSINNISEDEQAILYRLTFAEGPYDVVTIDALQSIREKSNDIISDAELKGELHFAGETAYTLDQRSVSNRDLILIVVLETVLIFSMLIFLTRSFRITLFMMGTILFSFAAALGLGIFLVNILFDIDTISNRVPVYAFVFLVALGIDYNIFLVSRYLEERRLHSVKEAVQIAVAHTGGVISSAGIVLAATFAVLMTQPVEVLFVFGFIVALGILMDTFLIRGILMPGLLVLFEKENEKRRASG